MTRDSTHVRAWAGTTSCPLFSHLRLTALLLLLLIAAQPPAAGAKGVYQAPEDFVKEVFDGEVPPPQTLWLTQDIAQGAEKILGHPLRLLRVHYWAKGSRSAWILEETGKEQPITTGIVIDGGKVAQMRVLIYRENRGDEVRQPFFLDQFKGTGLTPDNELDRHIDGVSGATLSTRALTKLARLALFLNQQRHGSP